MTSDPNDRMVTVLVVGVVVLACAVAGPLIQQARKARAAQDTSMHMTPAIPVPSESAPFSCTCVNGYAALAEVYGR